MDMTPLQRIALAFLWLAILAFAGYVISQRLQVGGDLRRFMPGQAGKRRVARVWAARAAGKRRATRLFAVRSSEVWT